MKEQELAELLKCYREGGCTEEEITLLESWYAGWNMEDRIGLSESELRDAENEMRQEVLPRKKKGVVTMLHGVAAAVAIFVSLSACLYIYLNKSELPLAQKIATNKDDVAPGTNKATLTLSNGTTIILNEADKGVLATQGNHKVVKMGGSVLSYQTAGSPVDQRNAPTYNTLTIPRGGQYQLVLSDGTKVWMNAASSITYPTAFTGRERKVAITGEAYFEVQHNEKQPFIVETDGEIIEVLGTHFDVYAYSDEPLVSTTLLSGSVKVSLSRSDRSRLLSPGEQMQVSKAGEVKVLKGVNTDQVVAWTKGQLSMEDVNVKSLMSRLSRWYDVDIQYEGEIPREKFGGMISRNVYLSNVLSVLDANGIHARLEGKTIIVSSK